MDPLFMLFMLFLFFLAGVGLGALVLATRIQNAVKRGIAAAKAEEQKAVVTVGQWGQAVENKIDQIKKVL